VEHEVNCQASIQIRHIGGNTMKGISGQGEKQDLKKNSGRLFLVKIKTLWGKIVD